MTNVVCESRNKSWVLIDRCQLSTTHTNQQHLNVALTFLHPTNSVTLRLQVMKKAIIYKPWLLDVTVDGCKFMRYRNHKVTKAFWDLIKDDSSINHSCPCQVVYWITILNSHSKLMLVIQLSQGQQFLRDFYPTLAKLPILPTGDFVLLIAWKFYGNIQFVTNLNFTFIESKIM